MVTPFPSDTTYFNNTARMVLDSTYAGPVQSTLAAGFAHMQTWPSLMTYSLPSFDLSLSMPACGLGILTDPRYTIAQMTWNSMTGQGLGLGVNGVFQGFGFGTYPGLNVNSPWGLGNTWGIGNSGNSSNSPSKEEIEQDRKDNKAKYDDIKAFLDGITSVSPAILSDSKIKEYKELLKDDVNKEKLYGKKFDKLETFYKSISPSLRQQYIITKYAAEFTGIGFPDENTEIDEYTLKQVRDRLEKIDRNNANTDEIIETLLQVQKGKEISVISAISAYNSKYKPSGDDGLIKMLREAYENAASDQKDTAVKGLEILCEGLVQEARTISKNPNLDAATKKNIKAAIESLEKYSTSKSKITSLNMEKAFNNLYVITRIASAKLAENKVKSELSKFDANISAFIMERTEEDLKEEGLYEEYKKYENKVAVEGNNPADNSTVITEEPQTPAEIIKSLKDDGIIETSDNKLGSSIKFKDEEIPKDRPVYTAYTDDANKKIPHYFVQLKNGNFVEVKKESSTSALNQWALVKNAKEITPSELRSMVEKVNEKTEDLDNRIRQGRLFNSDESFYEYLEKQNGSDRHYERINETLHAINENNVLDFMSSYINDYCSHDSGEKERYDDGRRLQEGFFERLDDEVDCGRRGKDKRNKTGIHMNEKLIVIKAFLDMVKNKHPELADTKQFAEIVQIYDTYSPDKYEDGVNHAINHRPRWMRFQTFNHKSSNDSPWADVFKGGIGRLFAWGRHTTNQVTRHPGQYMDNTVLDANMLALIRAIQEKGDESEWKGLLLR